MLQSPSGILLFLASGQVVSLEVITNPSNLRFLLSSAAEPAKLGDEPSSQIKNLFAEPFDEHIRKMLATGSQPILKLNDANDISPKATLELLIYATQTLREQYIAKHEKVRQEIEKRVRILRLLKDQQVQEIAQLEADKTGIRTCAENLAERYEEANDRQQMLMRRTQDIIRLVNMKVPGGATIDKTFALQLERLDAKVKDLANGLILARKKVDQQKVQITAEKATNEKKFLLPPRQEKVIKESIMDLYVIAGQICRRFLILIVNFFLSLAGRRALKHKSKMSNESWLT